MSWACKKGERKSHKSSKKKNTPKNTKGIADIEFVLGVARKREEEKEDE